MCSVFDIAIYNNVFKSYTFYIPDILYSDLSCNTINDRIKKFRLQKGLTQLQFAQSINKGFSTITKWEQNIFTPDAKSIEDIISSFILPKNYFE